MEFPTVKACGFELVLTGSGKSAVEELAADRTQFR